MTSTVNTLIIGAARSGTTALVAELQGHPDIFVTDPKETNFFAYHGGPTDFTGPGDAEMIGRRMVRSPDEMAALLAPSVGSHVRLEGSVSSLYCHERAIENIQAHASPDAKMIIILRSPAERAYSNYLYLVSRGYETADTFEEALALETGRIEAGWHHIWHYRALSQYAAQLDAYVEAFGRERLHIGLHDDFEQAPTDYLTSVLRFLELDEHGISDRRVGAVNNGGIPKSRLLHATMLAVRRSELLEAGVRRAIPQRLRERLRSVSVQQPEMDEATRADLSLFFEPDIARVEALTGRSCQHWRARS